MKKIFIFSILLFIVKVGFTQKADFNRGGTKAKNYFIELPYELEAGKIIVKIDIGGKPNRFLFDTGASMILYGDIIKEISTLHISKIKLYDSQSNEDSVDYGIIKKIKLGNIYFENVPSIFSPGDYGSECFNLDGIIGSNLIRNSIVQFNSKKKIIIITDNKKRLKLPAKYSSKISYEGNQCRPFIKVHFNEKVSEEVLFDSGSNSFYDICIRNYKLLATHKVYNDSLTGFGSLSGGIFGIEKKNKKLRLKINSFRIGKSEIKNVWAFNNSGHNSKIGLKLLKYGKVTIDYKHKKFYFDAFNEIQKYKEKSWPVSAVPSGGKCIVVFVLDKISAKINIGDELKEIDGEKVNLTDLCDLIHKPLFKDKVEAVVTLEQKDGTIKKVKIYKE